MISTIILTHNESGDIRRCITALAWCDDIHVVDSGSTDQTVAISRELGAAVVEHPFASFGDQRNWALDHCALKHEWVLFLDADEVSTPAFAGSLTNACAAAESTVAGFYCCWKMIWRGRWLKRCDSFPKWQFRVVRRGRARFADFGHGQKESDVQGSLGYLREPYEHYFMSKGLHHWVERHNRYSDQEALVRTAASSANRGIFDSLFSGASSERAKALRVIVSRMPGGPLLRFAWMYLVKLGCLEGSTGFAYCVLMSYYEFLIKQKMLELRRSN